MTDPDAPARDAPRLQDVAREAGVSLATASRALNGSSRRVADAYRVRVEAAAARLGYTANLSAQATARGTSAVVALVVADIADPYFGQIAAGVAREAARSGLVVTIAATGRDPDREREAIHALRGQRPRAIILASSRTAGRSEPRLHTEMTAATRAGSRVVVVGPGGDGHGAVTVDNRAGARSLGAAMGWAGYRDAVVLAAARGVRTSDDRLDGFTDGLVGAGGRIAAVYRGDFSRESGRALAARALADGLAPGILVFAVADVVALGAMSALRDAGRRIGADVAVAGFDDIPTGRDVTPALTTVHIPLEEVGAAALRAAIDDEAAVAAFPLDVVVRDSTPPRRPAAP